MTKYIKFDFSKFSQGNIVNSFGYVDSSIEKAIKMVNIPINSAPRVSTSSKKGKCFDTQKNVVLKTYCKLSVHSKDRINHGCAGKSRKSFFKQNISSEQWNSAHSYNMILNPFFQKLVSTNSENWCLDYNKRHLHHQYYNKVHSKP